MEFRNRSRRTMTEVNLTPLIDIVFNLLIFFLITTTFVQNAGIDVTLPEASAAPTPQEETNINIAITEEGRFVFEGQAIDNEELRTKLNTHHEKHGNALVIIQADEKTDHGQVVKAMDIARTVGFKRLAIATQSP